jgi:acetyl-CoA carboxylase carboxyltransferase component
MTDRSPGPEAGLRRIDVPVLIDSAGTVWVPGMLDTTLRHGGRVVLAESPPAGLPERLAAALHATAAGLARPGGATTLTFLADLARGELRYLESTPHLPPEHALLEATTGLDLAARALHLSRGGLLKGEPPAARGHAVQVCLQARDPEAGFAPSPGRVETLRLPAGAGLRADPEIAEGEEPGAAGDLALVRLTAHGGGRPEALDRLQRGLAGTVATVRGGATDKAFLAEVLDRLVLGAAADPDWLDRLVERGEHLPRRGAEAALLEAAIAGYEAELDGARARFLAAGARGRLEVPAMPTVSAILARQERARTERRLPAPEGCLSPKGEFEHRPQPDPAEPISGASGYGLELAYRRERYRFHLLCLAPGRYRVEVDGCRFEVQVGPRSRSGRRLAWGRRRWQVRADAQGDGLLVEVDGIPHRIARAAAGAPALPAALPAGPRLRFTAPAPGAGRGEGLAEVLRLLLGYDFAPRLVEAQLAVAGAAPGREEEAILHAFADLAALFRPPLAEDARHGAEESLFTYLRHLDAGGEGLPPSFLERLRRALAHYGVASLARSPELEEALFRIAVSHRRAAERVPPVLALLERYLERGDLTGAPGATHPPVLRDLLDRIIAATQGREPAVHDLAREVRYRGFDRPLLRAVYERIYAAAEADLARLAAHPAPPAEERAARIRSLVECTQPLHRLLAQRFAASGTSLRRSILEVMLRRYYRIHPLTEVAVTDDAGRTFITGDYEHRGARVRVLATYAAHARLAEAVTAVCRRLLALPRDGREVAIDLYLWHPGEALDPERAASELAAQLARPDFPTGLRRVAVSLSGPAPADVVEHFTFRPEPPGAAGGEGGGYAEDRLQRGLHPMMAQRLQIWRLKNFLLERLPAPEGVYLFHGVAEGNPRDERLFALAEVRDLTPVRDAAGLVVQLPQLEHTLMEALAGIRRFQSRRPRGERLQWNRVLLYAWPPIDLQPAELQGLLRLLGPLAQGLGLEKVAVRCRIPDREGGELREWVLEISNPGEGGMVLRFRKPAATPIKPLREYAQKVVELRRRGLIYPYEMIKRLAPPRQATPLDLPAGDFVEHDLDAAGRLVPVDRPYGGNTAALVVGVVRSYTERYPEGMARVLLLSDPSRGIDGMGEPEHRRVEAALELAAALAVPLEWFALAGSGAGGSGETTAAGAAGVARVLRRVLRFTAAGGEINLVVPGLNAGAQTAWNAAATLRLRTRGILIMTPEGSMVLSAGAEDAAAEDQAAGGYERTMGPNGQAQYFARDLGEACRTLLAHYEHTYVAPGERFPRPVPTHDPRDRDVRGFPHGGALATVGDVLAAVADPERRQPFEIRRVMAAIADQYHPPLERWYGMRDAEAAVVWETCLGGHPVCLLAFEAKPLPRLGAVPVEEPAWAGGALPPLAAKKVARAIDAASGNRPLVVLANLAGLDASPEALRGGQLEYAAEIARALVEFRGPIVVCVLVPPPDGAFLSQARALNEEIEVVPLGLPERLRPDLIEAVERGIERVASALRQAEAPVASVP